ncbi:hypothetical protein SAMN05421821_10522 [Mucilaginibacter lappiensis]|uniref:Uncharacterized protein n=1 Tax=Mucilaginibacter lappiensis TaxID=354630 RepID=A0ABR6PMV5_9SPHI|nr:hypothetical protein [Mucilaginibacter lappiensis]MBB6109606.1 hypothetical protein [Mucilaginibacter lappiensis]SIR09203.1 hypothetical protein SAMN05421821_10522 [Mucilaginibacter lappiensis]
MKIATCLLLLTIYSFNHKLNNNIIIGDHVVLNQEPDVSLVNLIANPDKYNGKKIRVIGYLHLEFEGNGLYLHKDDYDHAISKNSIWVSIGPKHPEVSNLKQYSDHYVIMEGTYNSEMTGHMGMNSGSIENITRLDIWEPANWKPIKKK